MKKKFLAILSLAIAVIILMNLLPAANAAADSDLLIGDADRDNDVTVMDATAIQRKIAGLREFAELEDFLADVDGNGQTTIVDATIIQRRLADLGDGFWTDLVRSSRPRVIGLDTYNYYPYYRSAGTVFAQTTILFSCYAETYRDKGKTFRNRYSFYINNDPIITDSESNSISYSFAIARTYIVKAVVHNTFGDSEYTQTITVKDSPERPYVADAVYDTDKMTLSVRAAGGKGGYQYKYYIRHMVPPEPSEGEPTDPPYVEPTEGPTEPSFTPEPRPDGTYEMVSDFSEASTIKIPEYLLNSGMEYQFYVIVRDSAGTESVMSQVMIYQ